MKTRQIPAVGKTSDQKRSREFMGSVMTIVGGDSPAAAASSSSSDGASRPPGWWR